MMSDDEKQNLEKYWDVVKKLEPEYYLVRLTLKETHVNIMILPKVIRAIYNLSIGTGYGKVILSMTKGKITHIESKETDQVNEDAVLDN